MALLVIGPLKCTVYDSDPSSTTCGPLDTFISNFSWAPGYESRTKVRLVRFVVVLTRSYRN